MAQSSARKSTSGSGSSATRFESVRIESLFTALDAVAWLDSPTVTEVAQFAGVDPRTAGKLLKNACQIGLVDREGDGHILMAPYPYKGTPDQKRAVVQEALIRLPLLASVRQFLKLGDPVDSALRKAATIGGIIPFAASDLNPLLKWAESVDALRTDLLPEDLVDEATTKKELRHQQKSDQRIAFLSHSSRDKGFIRQLAADLTSRGVGVWLDEQHIRVGDSIPEKIAQGLAESDFFIIAISEHSLASPWVQKELNNALMTEVQRRKVHVLPAKLDSSPIPTILQEKNFADFSVSYKQGLEALLSAIEEDSDGIST